MYMSVFLLHSMYIWLSSSFPCSKSIQYFQCGHQSFPWVALDFHKHSRCPYFLASEFDSLGVLSRQIWHQSPNRLERESFTYKHPEYHLINTFQTTEQQMRNRWWKNSHNEISWFTGDDSDTFEMIKNLCSISVGMTHLWRHIGFRTSWHSL